MSRVHFINKPAPMPPFRDGEVGRRLQGGLPPVPYRSASSKWASCPTKWAREPFGSSKESKKIKMEILAERKSGW
jgi:hypothetical protein